MKKDLDKLIDTLPERVGETPRSILKQFINDKIEERDNHWKKILNSGRKMYELGKKEGMKEITDKMIGEEINLTGYTTTDAESYWQGKKDFQKHCIKIRDKYVK